jgi:hypothetical protein
LSLTIVESDETEEEKRSSQNQPIDGTVPSLARLLIYVTMLREPVVKIAVLVALLPSFAFTQKELLVQDCGVTKKVTALLFSPTPPPSD